MAETWWDRSTGTGRVDKLVYLEAPVVEDWQLQNVFVSTAKSLFRGQIRSELSVLCHFDVLMITRVIQVSEHLHQAQQNLLHQNAKDSSNLPFSVVEIHPLALKNTQTHTTNNVASLVELQLERRWQTPTFLGWWIDRINLFLCLYI